MLTASTNAVGVGGVAGEDPDRDRSGGRVGEQRVLDLGFAFLAVAGVAARGQFAVGAFHPGGGGQVEHGQAVLGEVPAGQPCFDAVLAGA
jgi:hypothetical protein